jgi:sodium transport system permease protein
MQLTRVKTILRKELRDILRDRRTIFVNFVLPILLYPLLMIGFMQIAALQVHKIGQKKSRVIVLGEQHSPQLARMLDTLSTIQISESADWRARIQNGELDAALRIPANFSDSVAQSHRTQALVFYNSSKEVSEEARKRLERVLTAYREQVISERLAYISADTSLLHPFSIETENLASDVQQQGAVLGRILGYLFIFVTLTGAFYTSVDLTAGEKERGTLETLLVSPASRTEIVYGKFLAVTLIALVTAVLNVLSFGVTMIYSLQMFGKSAEKMLPVVSVEPASLLMALLLIIPLAVTFAAVCLAIAVGARTYKEGQALLTPLYMVVILPAMFSMLPGMEMSPKLAIIPIVNVSLLIKEYMIGNYVWLETMLAFISTSLLAVVSLLWATNQFNQESVLFRHAEDVRWSPFRKRRGPLPFPQPLPGTALLLVLVEIIALFAFGSFALKWGAERTILFSQLALILLPPLYILYRGGYNIREVLTLVSPKVMAYPATLLFILGGWLFAIQLGTWQNMLYPFPEDLLKQFKELFAELEKLPLNRALFFIAVLPGICEELLCRGFLLRSFLPRFGKLGSIVLVAVAFGLLHLNPYRMIPTAFLGVVLGFIALETGSLYPAMLAHATNNALSYLVEKNSAWFEDLKWLKLDESQSLPWYFVIASAVALVLGYVWLKKVGQKAHATLAESGVHST